MTEKHIKTLVSQRHLTIRKYFRAVDIHRISHRAKARRALWVDEWGGLWAKANGYWHEVRPTDYGYVCEFLHDLAVEVQH